MRISLLSLLGSLFLLGALGACPRETPGAADTPPLPATRTAVPGTPLWWHLPAGWSVRAPEATPGAVVQAPSAAGRRLEDAGASTAITGTHAHTQLVASGRREASTSASTLPPRVEVYRSAGLAAGTSISDFLVANRQSQAQALGDIPIRHLEVEPVRRSGRAGFHLRDAFDVPLPQGGQAPVSQQAVLLLDGDQGYVVVVTLLEDDLARLLDEIRAWMGSLSFDPG